MELKLPDSLVRAREYERYAAERDALRPGHRVHLLIDGVETFPAMLTAIARARRYVHLETYILKADHIGRMFASSPTNSFARSGSANAL